MRLLLLSSLWLVAGCAGDFSSTHPGEQRAVADSLYCGTAIQGGATVGPREWERFVAEVVTVRFPQGITAWSASGQWRNRSGRLEKENSHVLLIVHPDSATAERAIVEIIASYKKRFRQESVLRVRTPARISF